jgi:hypothetical protein
LKHEERGAIEMIKPKRKANAGRLVKTRKRLEKIAEAAQSIVDEEEFANHDSERNTGRNRRRRERLEQQTDKEDTLDPVNYILKQGLILDPERLNPLIEIKCFQTLSEEEPHTILKVMSQLFQALTLGAKPEGRDPWLIRQRVQYELQAFGYARCNQKPSAEMQRRINHARHYRPASSVAELMRKMEQDTVVKSRDQDQFSTNGKSSLRRRGLKDEYKGKIIRLKIKKNPYRHGAKRHGIFTKLVDGMSVAEFLSIGGNTRILRHGTRNNHLTLENLK